MSDFPCTGCGACCKFVGKIRYEGGKFPEPALPNGHCVHLDSTNRCVIYKDRPDVCRIKPGTHLANARACTDIQDLLHIRGKRPDLALAAANDYAHRHR